jgi:hypothetical protein
VAEGADGPTVGLEAATGEPAMLEEGELDAAAEMGVA